MSWGLHIWHVLGPCYGKKHFLLGMHKASIGSSLSHFIISPALPAMDPIPQGVVEQVNKIMEQNGPPLSVWKGLVELFMQHKLAWKSFLPPGSLLVHPLNRGGLGVNGFAVHSKAASLLKTGWDKQYLHSATCCLS